MSPSQPAGIPLSFNNDSATQPVVPVSGIKSKQLSVNALSRYFCTTVSRAKQRRIALQISSFVGSLILEAF